MFIFCLAILNLVTMFMSLWDRFVLLHDFPSSAPTCIQALKGYIIDVTFQGEVYTF